MTDASSDFRQHSSEKLANPKFARLQAFAAQCDTPLKTHFFAFSFCCNAYRWKVSHFPHWIGVKQNNWKPKKRSTGAHHLITRTRRLALGHTLPDWGGGGGGVRWLCDFYLKECVMSPTIAQQKRHRTSLVTIPHQDRGHPPTRCLKPPYHMYCGGEFPPECILSPDTTKSYAHFVCLFVCVSYMYLHCLKTCQLVQSGTSRHVTRA